jgi:hypothetical protein
VEVGDLVKLIQNNAIGIVVEVFADLDPLNPWIKILFTHPHDTYQWCKVKALVLVSKKREDQNDPPLNGATSSGSL